MSPRRWGFLIGLLTLLTFSNGILMIDSIPLDSHEIFVAQTAREMAQRGDWIVPYFNGAPRLNKPPLSYWTAAAVAKLAGDLPDVLAWHVRLISVLAALGLLACTVITARVLFDPATALIAAGLLASSAGLFSFMHDARPDLLYAFWISVMIAAAAALAQPSFKDHRTWWIAGALWSGAALATLTKGPHLPALVVLGVALGLRQRLGSWRRVRTQLHPLAGAVWTLAVCLPWWWLLRAHLDTARVESSQLGGTLLAPALARFGDPYYLYRPLQLLLPWLPLAAIALMGYRRALARENTAILWWPLLVTLVGLSVGRQYRFFYVLPLLGVLAVLVARAWLCTVRMMNSRIERGLVMGALAVQIIALTACVGWVIQHAQGTPQFGLVTGILCASVALATFTWRIARGRALRSVLALAMGMCTVWSAAAITGALWDSERYGGHRLAELAHTQLATTTLATFGLSPTIYVYYLGRPVVPVATAREIDALFQQAGGVLGLVARDHDIPALALRYGLTELGQYRRGDGDDVLLVLRAKTSAP